MTDFIASLFEVARPQFPDGTDAVLENERMRFSWKTNDDPSRPSKRAKPVVITLHEDFRTSELGKRPLAEIHEEFAAFIVIKRAQLNPCETDHANQTHTPEHWIFPEQC